MDPTSALIGVGVGALLGAVAAWLGCSRRARRAVKHGGGVMVPTSVCELLVSESPRKQAIGARAFKSGLAQWKAESGKEQ